MKRATGVLEVLATAAVLTVTQAAWPGFAQDSHASDPQMLQTLQTPQPAQTPQTPQTPSQDLERRLQDAQKRLEDAARQVAELSAQMGVDARNRALVIGERFGRGAMIGLQLDPASGTDGARVLDVSPGGPAAEAGVRRGDVIVALNGTPTTGNNAAEKLVDRVRALRPDAKVTLSIKRGGKVEQVQLTTRPAYAFQFASPFDGPGPVVVPPLARVSPMPEMPEMPDLQYLQVLSDQTAGMELATLSPSLGSYFGTDKGVLVLRASENDAFQLKDGDVILSIDGREPQNGAHATRILRSYQPGERITLKIMRQKHPLSLNVTLPQPRPRAQVRGRVRIGPEVRAGGPGAGESDSL